jgi:cytochrome c
MAGQSYDAVIRGNADMGGVDARIPAQLGENRLLQMTVTGHTDLHRSVRRTALRGATLLKPSTAIRLDLCQAGPAILVGRQGRNLVAVLSLIHRNAVPPAVRHAYADLEDDMRTILFIALIAFGIASSALAQQDKAVTKPQPIKIVGDAKRGEALVTRWCTSCHRLSDDGTASDQAPSIRWIADLARKNPDYIRTFLNHPHAPMPPLDLDRTEIEDAVAYFREFGKR